MPIHCSLIILQIWKRVIFNYKDEEIVSIQMKTLYYRASALNGTLPPFAVNTAINISDVY